MFEKTIVQTTSGKKIRIDHLLKQGGQGTVYTATQCCNNKERVVKDFADELKNSETLKRIEFLINQDLESISQLFVPPQDIIRDSIFGYSTRKAPGMTLETLLENPDLLNLQEAFILSITICHSLKLLNQMGILYGDIHPGNFIVNNHKSCPQLSVIDFDNFQCTSGKIPQPSCIGHILYLAPETRKLFLDSKPAILTQETDNFALACLLHNILLFKHQSTGHDNTEVEFHKAMMSGIWNHDPLYSKTKIEIGGYPSEAISPAIARLFRRGFSLNPFERPTPEEWKEKLSKEICNIFVCEDCGGGFVLDISKERCPHCHQKFPIFKLKTNSVEIPIDTTTVAIGRSNLRGNSSISSKHALFKRLGPEVKLICMGLNPTFKFISGKWIQLPNGKEILIKENDRFRFSNIEANIVRV